MKYGKSIWLCLFFAFILGSHNGYVALWEGNDPQPKKVFPYSVSSLPPADQQRLKEGIPIESKEELIRLVEDYLS